MPRAKKFSPVRKAIVALLRPEVHRELAPAFRGYEVLRVEWVRELLPTANRPSVSVVVTEPWDAAGVPLAPTIQSLKAAYPSIPVLTFCEQSIDAHREALPLARAGIDGIILRGVDDGPSILRSAIREARMRAVEAEVLAEVKPFAAVHTALFIQHCIRHVGQPISVQQTATVLNVDRKTLLNRFRRDVLPPPSDMLAWCRVLVASRMLEDAGRSEEQVGIAIGCGSGTALRNLFLRHTGLRPSTVRASGGLSYTLGLFVARLQGKATVAEA